jgi:hypothetical protein
MNERTATVFATDPCSTSCELIIRSQCTIRAPCRRRIACIDNGSRFKGKFGGSKPTNRRGSKCFQPLESVTSSWSDLEGLRRGWPASRHPATVSEMILTEAEAI